MREFRCGHLVPGCDAVFHCASDDEILVMVESHARDEHGMPVVPPEVVDEVVASISDVTPEVV
jgi:predicted small metal-binding protein